MIGKLLRAIGAIVVYTCVATIIAEGVLALHFGRAWKLNRDKCIQMLAIAQGVDLAAIREEALGEREEPSREQPSYNQVLEARAVKTRNLELREQSLRGSLVQLQTEQRKLNDEKTRLAGLREAFKGELAATEKGALATGREETCRTLESLKAKQAKELLVQMLDKKEIDEVVAIVTGMSENKRAKIIAEFKSQTENEQIGEVLNRIRQGTPAANIADNTQKQIGQ
jgi:hypothetical protein